MTIDLQKFCGTEDSRTYLNKPFTRGEWTWATDGHIIIRVPRVDGVPDNSGLPTDDGLARCLAATSRTLDKTLDRYKIPPPVVLQEPCPHCDGSGHEHDCPSCICICRDCTGSGLNTPKEDISVDICGAPFAAKYVRLLKSLPNVVIRAAEELNDCPRIVFTFGDGGEGALMGLRSASANHIKESTP